MNLQKSPVQLKNKIATSSIFYSAVYSLTGFEIKLSNVGVGFF